jgi:1-deoxyxylulose-5-phosphate synthase
LPPRNAANVGPEPNYYFTIVDRVTEIANKPGVSNAQIALAWMLSKPEIIAPIIGASKQHHLDDALTSLDVHPDAEEIKALEERYEPHPILGYK